MAVVAVLGASNGGLTTAADLALRGHTVRWWSRSADALAAVRDAGGITVAMDGERRLARLALATDSLGAAIGDAEVIVAPLPATSHDELAVRLAPLLTDRQIVLLTPGTLGAHALARGIARAEGRLPFALAETATLPYLTRKAGPAEVRVAVRAANLPLGVFPAARTAQVAKTVATLYPGVHPCADALDAALNNAGPVIHPPLVLLNAGAIDSGRFDIHVEGTTATVRALIDAVDAERVATRTGWGYGPPHYELATYYDEARAAEGFYGAGARARVAQSRIFDETLGLDHRYVTEDVALGLTLFESAGRTATVDTPAVSGLLQVFGALLGRRLGGNGRALEGLGLGDLSLREIRTFLHEGWASPQWARILRQ
jgi:opine dehydrogenase